MQASVGRGAKLAIDERNELFLQYAEEERRPSRPRLFGLPGLVLRIRRREWRWRVVAPAVGDLAPSGWRPHRVDAARVADAHEDDLCRIAVDRRSGAIGPAVREAKHAREERQFHVAVEQVHHRISRRIGRCRVAVALIASAASGECALSRRARAHNVHRPSFPSMPPAPRVRSTAPSPTPPPDPPTTSRGVR